jgi:4-amino-4-deoxy-L-arabinose transferase-like glycosyltransferase
LIGGHHVGNLQTFFYLALISAVMIGLTLFLIGIIAAGLRRWFRQGHDQSVLTFWLVGGAITVMLLFIILGTAGVLYGFLRYGAS